jgi:diaminohydroxyphosphoribosylaminopyrimidine deaminase/5-amino-6-(5-phosphoribosylamino)uracil reductase
MHRCLELAKLGAGNVAPNPMVGAVLVHNEKIIGEGWHQKYGEAHAEPNCINDAIKNGFAHVINNSTLYVSLEPCAHFGKTPPCTDIIIKHKIPQVVIGCRDLFPEVDGKGMQKLREAAIRVEAGVLEEECRELNKRFFTFHELHRPFVVLKWAQTNDGFIAHLNGKTNERLLISNTYSNRLVHQWRNEEAAILVGTNTALTDDPELTNRHWPGNSPVRLVIDLELRLPLTLKLFNRSVKTIVFNTIKHEEEDNLLYYQVTSDVSIVDQVLNALYQMNIQSVLIEGGARLVQTFIEAGAWDEARVILNTKMEIGEGLRAPLLEQGSKFFEEQLANDNVSYYKSK